MYQLISYTLHIVKMIQRPYTERCDENWQYVSGVITMVLEQFMPSWTKAKPR
jgi:hypothetical protein